MSSILPQKYGDNSPMGNKMKEDNFMEFINGVILIEAVKSMPIWLQITAYFVTLAIFVLDIYITFKVSRSIAEGEIIKPLIAEVLGVALLVTAGAFAKGEIGGDYFKVPNGLYRVTVTAEADMTEFQDTYEIVDYKDGVYTIKPKENINEN